MKHSTTCRHVRMTPSGSMQKPDPMISKGYFAPGGVIATIATVARLTRLKVSLRLAVNCGVSGLPCSRPFIVPPPGAPPRGPYFTRSGCSWVHHLIIPLHYTADATPHGEALLAVIRCRASADLDVDDNLRASGPPAPRRLICAGPHMR